MFPKRKPLACYAACTKDSRLLMASASGGAFTELARVVLAEGGVVFGAVWEKETFRVIHKWVDTEAGLEELRGSKYATSDLSQAYSDAQRFLQMGKKVLFTGMPCQIAAISKVVGEQPNLILCALFCMSNVNVSVWLDYVAALEKNAGSKLVRVKHRHKIPGEHRSYFLAEFEDASKNFIEPLYQNAYWRLFANNAKMCCRSCAFKSGRHPADLMIGDFWKIEQFMPDIKWVNGASAILVYSQKGSRVLAGTSLELHRTRYSKILYGNPYLERSFVPGVTPKLGMFMRIRRKLGRILRALHLR